MAAIMFWTRERWGVFVCQKSGYDWKKGLGTGGESVLDLDLDRRIRLDLGARRAFWACVFFGSCFCERMFWPGLRVSIRLE